MNSDQINSLVRSGLKIIGTALIARGLTTEAALVNSEDVVGIIIMIVGLIMSHFQHGGGGGSGGNGDVLPKAAAVMLAAGLFATGCQSGIGTAYKIEKSADVTVSAAMSAWGDYVATHEVSVSQEQTVKDAFEKYRKANLAAIDATAAFAYGQTSTNASPAEIEAAQREAVKSASAALADLVELIRQFGGNI